MSSDPTMELVQNELIAILNRHATETGNPNYSFIADLIDTMGEAGNGKYCLTDGIEDSISWLLCLATAIRDGHPIADLGDRVIGLVMEFVEYAARTERELSGGAS